MPPLPDGLGRLSGCRYARGPARRGFKTPAGSFWRGRYLKAALKKIRDAVRDSEFRWRYISNLGSWASYALKHPRLEGEAAGILDELNRAGIAVTSFSKLFGDSPLWDELKQRVEKLELDQADQIAQARAEAEELKQKKGFIFPLLGDKPEFDERDICVRVLQGEIKKIADAYMGLHTVLNFYNVWHTFRIQGEPRRSQLWHQDPEDHFIFRVFIYLTDVDAGAGPLVYVSGSHPKGRRIRPEFFREAGHGAKRSTDEQMQAVAPRERWVQATGKAGTIIFADTRGYHKGGLARERDRIMYNAMFTSPASKSPGIYKP